MGEELRNAIRCSILKDLRCHGKDFGFFSEVNGKSRRLLNQRNDVIVFKSITKAVALQSRCQKGK